MPKKKTIVKKVQKKKSDYVVVTSRSYGKALKGTKIYFEGKKPTGLKKDGSITCGKHILEILNQKFEGNFRWIITEKVDSITLERKIYRVRTSQQTLSKIGEELWDRTRDIKNDIVSNVFSVLYTEYFNNQTTSVYVPGTLSRLLGNQIISRLSTNDREAINKFLPDYAASESLHTVNILKAEAQIKTLKELAADLEQSLNATKTEGWWQTYIQKNILIIQQGYIAAIEKLNTVVGGTKFPDFCLVTHDNYLDILEIKKPDTAILKFDKSRGNYFWDPELAKAVIQVENYIESIQHNADAIRNFILDNYKIHLKVLRPRGIILAGDTRKFTATKQADDFRLLSLSTKNIQFVTYDELLSRLQNYIKILEDHSK